MKSGVLYIAFVREDSEAIGFVKKIHSQCKAFSNLGFNTFLFITTSTHANLYSFNEREVSLIKSVEYSKRAKFMEDRNILLNKLSSYYRFNEFLNIIKNEIRSLNINNIYYRRMKPITLRMIRFFRFLKLENIKIFYEYPDYPVYKPSGNNLFQKISHIYDLTAFKLLKNYIEYIVGITYKKITPTTDIITIKNGIDLNTTPLKNKIKNKENNINLICVANLAYWHAYDRVLNGMNYFYKNNPNLNQKIFFHIVGEGDETSKLKDMVKEMKLTNVVKFHGTKTGYDLNQLINESDIGVGALGTHRKNIQGNSSLKNREYCARGLPFILAGDDYDFDDSFIYKMQISPDESPLDIEEVIKFYNELTRMEKDYSKVMRHFAAEHLTWESKLIPVVKFFN